MTASISFIAPYAEDLEATADFYRTLDLPLTREQHGDGPVHYSTPIGNTVLELFQATKDKPKTLGLTIGVTVNDAEGVIERLKAAGLSEPGSQNDTKTLAHLIDPEGNQVIVEKLSETLV